MVLGTVCGCGPVWVLCLVVVVLLSDGKEGTTPAVARRRSHSSLTRTFHANCGRCFQLLSSTVTLFLVLQFVTNFSIIHKCNFCHSLSDKFLIFCHLLNCCCSLCEDYHFSRSRIHIFIKWFPLIGTNNTTLMRATYPTVSPARSILMKKAPKGFRRTWGEESTYPNIYQWSAIHAEAGIGHATWIFFIEK